MLAQLVPLIVNGVVSTAAGIGFDAVTRIATPTRVRAITGFAIKAGSHIVGGYLASKLADYATTSATAVVDAIQAPKAPEALEAAASTSKPE